MSCRLCLSAVDPLNATNIFTVCIKNEFICDIITTFAAVPVHQNDNLSRIICQLCLERLQFVVKFKQLIINSDKQLRQPEQNTSIIKLEDEDENNSELQQLKPDLNISTTPEINAKDEISSVYLKCEENSSDETINNDATRSKRHSKIINSENKSNKIRCRLCGQTFKNSYDVEKHKVTEHTGTYRFKCDVCNKGFFSRTALKVHMTRHTDERPLKCNVCEKTFKNIVSLTTHKKLHSEIKPHVCSFCPNKAFAQKGALQEHLKSHKKDSRLVCEFCGKSFREKRSLDLHTSKVHKGDEVPYLPCPQCGKLYSGEQNLNRHIIVIHAEERTSFPCSICDKKFSVKGSLKIHMRIHEGVKPYSCDICGKEFTQSGVAVKHKRVHTKETPFGCEVCGKQFGYKHHLKSHFEKDHKDSAQET